MSVGSTRSRGKAWHGSTALSSDPTAQGREVAGTQEPGEAPGLRAPPPLSSAWRVTGHPTWMPEEVSFQSFDKAGWDRPSGSTTERTWAVFLGDMAVIVLR